MEILLDNEVKMPLTGFGTDTIPEGEQVINAVTNAIESGYRMIDTAYCYKNETGCGIAIKNCIDKGIIKREDLFITTKIHTQIASYNNTLKYFNESLKKLGVEYVDLYILHEPARLRADWQIHIIDIWRAIEKLYKEGKIKAIGVSNFEIRHLEFLLREAEIKPMVNQIELHPEHQQKEVVEYCKEHDIVCEAWGSLNQGRVFKNTLLSEMATKYNKTISQIAVRWSIQKGFIPLARSVKKERIQENYNVFDFEILDDDMKYIDSLDGGEWSKWHCDALEYPVKEINSSTKESFKPEVIIYCLFGILPILKIKKIRDNKTKYYLFGLIPFMKVTRV